MYYIVCGTHAEILKERKETGSSILERMRKARCRRKGIHARSDEERISLTVAPATVSGVVKQEKFGYIGIFPLFCTQPIIEYVKTV